MPSTYTPIATTTLGTAANEVIFSSIPSTYTDLVFVAVATPSTSAYMGYGQFNGDTGNNYSETLLYGTGSVAGSNRESNRPNCYFGNWTTANSTTSPTTYTIAIMNYSNTTTNKTILSRSADAGTETNATVNLWRNTAAITSFRFALNTGNFIVGSTFTLYGIKAA